LEILRLPYEIFKGNDMKAGTGKKSQTVPYIMAIEEKNL
jgi:hypothetical protein